MKKPIITAEMINEAEEKVLFSKTNELYKALIAIELSKMLAEKEALQEPQEDLSPKYRELEEGYAVVRTCDIEKFDTSYLYWEAFIKKGKLSATHTEALQKDKLLLLTTKYKAYVTEYNGVPMGESRWTANKIYHYCVINSTNNVRLYVHTVFPEQDIEFYVKDERFKDFILKRMTIEEIRIVTTQDWRAIEV